MTEAVSGSESLNFKIMDRYLDIIESPFDDVCKSSTTDTECINTVNLNYLYCQDYYPEILDILKEDMYCCKDLYYDFYEIKNMSYYVFYYLKNIIADNIKKDVDVNVNEIVDLLSFINLILQDFHIIMGYKIKMINGIISSDEFDEKYTLFKHKFRKNYENYYINIYNPSTNEMTKTMNDIWRRDVV